MLYLVMEHYDNGESWEDYYDSDTVIGIYETKELAEKEIECIVEDHRKVIIANNEKVKKHECPNCCISDRDTCTECLNEFKKTNSGYTVTDFYTASYDYSIEEIELNQRIK